MSMEVAADPRRSFNPVLWIVWALPAATVVAGFATLFIAIRGADRALPPGYHWEGAGLDADFARARRAADLGVGATIEVSGGACVVRLSGDARPGDRLDLEIASGSDVALDRRVVLTRAEDGAYRAPCAPAAVGRWWITLRDPDSDWTLRARLAGALERFTLAAGKPT
jgi:hypothetical protein